MYITYLNVVQTEVDFVLIHDRIDKYLTTSKSEHVEVSLFLESIKRCDTYIYFILKSCNQEFSLNPINKEVG